MSSTSTTFEEMKGEFERIEAELMQAQANFEAAKFARDAVAKKHKQMKEELMEWQLNQPSRWNDNYRENDTFRRLSRYLTTISRIIMIASSSLSAAR